MREAHALSHFDIKQWTLLIHVADATTASLYPAV